jgi:outer membrane lipoprotein SlyB
MDEEQRTPATPEGETHATTGGAAAAGAIVAGAIGLTGGPIAAAVGLVGGAIVGAAAERMMHSEDDRVPSMDTKVPNIDAPSKSPD